MASYSFNQQPYLIGNLGYAYANTRSIVDGEYVRSSLFAFQNFSGPAHGPVSFGDVAKFTLNFSGGQWYINLRRADDSFITFFTVERLDYSDGDHLVFTDGNYDYVVSDSALDYTQALAIENDADLEPGRYRVGVNVAPSDIAVVSVGLAADEDASKSAVVGRVEAGDSADPGDTFTYALTDDAGGAFVIGATTGIIKVRKGYLLDFEQDATRTIEVEATDLGGLTRTETFTVTIHNVDPEDVSGDSAANTFVGGADDDVLRGLGGNDALSGGGGGDTLDGGTGTDDLRGGSGDDTYFVDRTDDAVSEATTPGGATDAGGLDEVRSTASFSLPDFVDNLVLSGTAAINGKGNGLANRITGNDKANTLTGGLGDDILLGQGGNDVLVGGRGYDVLKGGLGADVYDFNLAAETTVGASRDTVTFSGAEGDVIDLTSIDANTNSYGNQNFIWANDANLQAAFNGIAGELRLSSSGVLQADTNGDGTADFEIKVSGTLTLVDVLV